MKKVAGLSLVMIVAAVLAGCAAGPDYRRPPLPGTESYTREALPDHTVSASGPDGAVQRFLYERDIPGDWWQLFKSPQLNALVEEAIKANPGVEAAEATLRQARELALAQRGAFFPTVGASYSRTRARDSGALSPVLGDGESPYTLHTAQLSIAYAPDVFGGVRRAVESADARADAQRFQVEAVYVTLTSNLVAAAIQEAALREQVAAADEIVAINRRWLELMRRQLATGYIAGADVAAQEAALAQAEQALPALAKQLDQVRNQLAALAGKLPSQGSAEAFDLAQLELPEELPISLPSKLVEQRPDVLSAESALRAASADIGVAAANLLPHFNITAARGGAATAFAQMFESGNPFWSLAAGVTQTVFAGGTLVHEKRAAEAAFASAAAQYRATVIGAFQNVADALYALQADAQALNAAVNAEQAARRSLDLVTKQLDAGQVNYLALLSAQQTYQQTLGGLAQARAARFSDTAALFQALGGGWWNRPMAAS